jgi:hypothetical protein
MTFDISLMPSGTDYKEDDDEEDWEEGSAEGNRDRIAE